MQLDQTRIVIRERSFPELLDLTLVVGRRHFFPLLGWAVVGIAPWALVNYLLLVRAGQGFSADDLLESRNVSWYLFWMVMLVLWEIPAATAPLTIYLGQALFDDRPRPRAVLSAWWRSLGQLLWFQGLVRMLLVWPILTWVLPYSLWPYLNEVLLLERNPLWNKQKTGTTTWRRSVNLHSRSSGELFARWMGATMLGVWLTLGGWGLLAAFRSLVFKGAWDEDLPLYTVLFPLALWNTVAMLTVVRFLCYLDLRIRHEGWEIELQMRAEAVRWERRVA